MRKKARVTQTAGARTFHSFPTDHSRNFSYFGFRTAPRSLHPQSSSKPSDAMIKKTERGMREMLIFLHGASTLLTYWPAYGDRPSAPSVSQRASCRLPL